MEEETDFSRGKMISLGDNVDSPGKARVNCLIFNHLFSFPPPTWNYCVCWAEFSVLFSGAFLFLLCSFQPSFWWNLPVLLMGSSNVWSPEGISKCTTLLLFPLSLAFSIAVQPSLELSDICFISRSAPILYQDPLQTDSRREKD